MAEEDKMVWYRTPHSPTIAIWLLGQEYKAANSVIKVPEAAANELDRMALTRGDVASNFVKLTDMATAEAIAKAHRDANGRPDATQGGVSSAGTIKDGTAQQIDTSPAQPLVPTDLAPVVPPTTPNTLPQPGAMQDAMDKTVEHGTAAPVIKPATAIATPDGMSALSRLKAQNTTAPGAKPVN